MSRYTNCPTCGAAAEYVSGNFKQANLLTDTVHSEIKRKLEQIVIENARLELALEMLESERTMDINSLSSNLLLTLYIRAVEREQREKEEKRRPLRGFELGMPRFGFEFWPGEK